ncbi:HAD family phosphatase [Sporichthya brevicatena]|uniref:HAD family phosphatase n=1 Tax=Sporichthya brevicatena TaxID=171442 RepID=A0ABP3RDN4_9ACTN
MTTARLPAAVLWDMDGTLVDTEPYWIECEYAIVESFGGTWSDELAHSLVGNDLLESARFIAEAGGVPLEPVEIVEQLLDGVIERVRTRIPWRPGARELLEDLHARRVPCALVTMSWRRFAEAIVDAVPDRFAALVTGDEVDRPKPYPDPYLVAARLLGQNPADCVAIEDSPKGVASAVAAGVPTLAVQNVVPLSPGPGLTLVHTLEDWTPERLATLLPPPAPGR